MSLPSDQRNTIKLLKGAPLTVLLVMGLLGGQAGEKDLEAETGYSYKTVQKALQTLRDSKLVTRTHRYHGWMLTNGGRQMLLSGRAQPVDNPDETVDNFVDNSEAGDQRVGKIPNELESFQLPPTTTTTLTNQEELKDSKFNRVELSSSSSSNELENFQLPESLEFQKNLEALKEAGIAEPKRSELARLAHITPEYVRAHAEAHKREEGRRRRVGLLITKLQSGDPMPENANEKDYSGWLKYAERLDDDLSDQE